MIAITLNFTSIEAAIRALREIPENLLIGAPAVTHATTVEPEAAPAPKPVKAAKAATSPATAAPAAAPEEKTPSSDASTTTPAASASGAADPKPVATLPTASPTASGASEPTSVSSVDYPTLQKAVFALAGKSRDAAAAVAKSFGVKTFKELGQDQWAEALGAVNEKLAELEAA